MRNSLKSADGSGFDHDDPAISAGGWEQPALIRVCSRTSETCEVRARRACQKKKAGPEKKSHKPAFA
ncbi:MAG: hypothetical protein CW342_15300, partial [Thermoactinomycetaceae bacterium]|nr:hypothetical protein [Thermoactinomycetaceae bacterium]